MAGMELGKAYIQIIPSAQGIKEKIEKEMGIAGENSGNSFGARFKGAVSKLAIGAAIAKTIKDAFTEGAALEQSIGGIETLFKDASDKVITNAEKAWKTAGMSANQYMETATSFSASLLQGLSGDTAKAADITDMAIRDMSDNANKMGTDMSAIQLAYQGFAKQNYTMLDNLKLGYGGTKTEMERLLADAEKLTGKKYDINNLSDVYQAIHAIQEKLDITGTTAKEASSTLAGSFSSMKAAYKDLVGNMLLGNDISGNVKNLVESVVTVAKNVLPAVKNIIIALPQAITGTLAKLAPELLPMIADLVAGLAQGLADSLPVVLQNINDIFLGLGNGLIAALPTIISALPAIITSIANAIITYVPIMVQTGITLITSLVQALPEIINGIVAALPAVISGIIQAFISFLPQLATAGIQLFVALVQNLPTIITTIVNALPQIINAVITAFIDNIPLLINAGIQLFTALVRATPQIIVAVVKAVPQIIGALISAFGSCIGQFVNIGANIIAGMAQGIIKGIGSLVKAAVNAAKNVVKAVKNALGINSPSRVFAEIGSFIDAGLAQGINNNLGVVSRAVDELNTVVNDHFVNDIRMTHELELGYSQGEKKGEATVINQYVNIDQPVATPYETAKAIRKEANILGLAGA